MEKYKIEFCKERGLDYQNNGIYMMIEINNREYIKWLENKIKNLSERSEPPHPLLSDVDSVVKSIKRSDKGFIFQIELSDDEIDRQFFMERKQIILDKEEHGDRYRLKPSQELLLKITDELLSQMGTD